MDNSHFRLADLSATDRAAISAWCRKTPGGWRAEQVPSDGAAFMLVSNNQTRKALREVHRRFRDPHATTAWHVIRHAGGFVVVDDGRCGQSIAQTPTLTDALAALAVAQPLHS